MNSTAIPPMARMPAPQAVASVSPWTTPASRGAYRRTNLLGGVEYCAGYPGFALGDTERGQVRGVADEQGGDQTSRGEGQEGDAGLQCAVAGDGLQVERYEQEHPEHADHDKHEREVGAAAAAAWRAAAAWL